MRSPPFFLRDSRACETRVRLKITPCKKKRHTAGREKNVCACRLFSGGLIFMHARSTIPEEKWGTTRSLCVNTEQKPKPIWYSVKIAWDHKLYLLLIYYNTQLRDVLLIVSKHYLLFITKGRKVFSLLSIKMLQRKVSLNDLQAVQYMYRMKKRNFSSHNY